MTNDKIIQTAINTIRTLSIDAVQAAKSDHPGTAMALAPLVYTIWNRTMNFDPQDPIWPNRDRFVLSNGHASMLLWSVLHLTKTQAVDADYENLGHPSVSLDDIRRFRQIDSRAPGHPEYHWVSGVETTTGPLGQGVATSVGMALAQKWLAHRYNQPSFEIFNYNIYAVCGFTSFFWQDPKYGALQFSGQYSWLVRHLWFVGSGEPASASLNMLYLGLRYALPDVRPAGK